jgi:hypothetical protein
VGLDAAEVSRQQNVRNLAGLLFVETIALKYLDAESAQGFIIHVMVLHKMILLKRCNPD